jgi:hypothetical protein
MSPLFLAFYVAGGLFTWGGYEWRIRKSLLEAKPIIEISPREALLMALLMSVFWPVVWSIYAMILITDLKGRS